jgi:8-oxo-dGTP pyrophosphatase MutT (NUDIX family)
MQKIMCVSAGALFFCSTTQRCLFLMRSEKQRNTWGLVGGKQQVGETLLQTLHREFSEELGFIPQYRQLIPIDTFTSTDLLFKYHTFVCITETEFMPQLNHEHHGYCWMAVGKWPRPLHPGLWQTVNFAEIQNKIHTVSKLFHVK